MIKLFGRMIPAAARGLAQPRLHASDTVRSGFRVLPHDIDLNLHLNNGRYMQIIDVNRMEYLLRTGVAGVILGQGWKAVLGGTTIQFRRELRLWEQAVASTQLLGWDDRWVYLEHRIETRSGRLCAVALAKAGFRRAKAWVPIDELVAALPYAVKPMALPARVSDWQRLDDSLSGKPMLPVPARKPLITASTAQRRPEPAPPIFTAPLLIARPQAAAAGSSCSSHPPI